MKARVVAVDGLCCDAAHAALRRRLRGRSVGDVLDGLRAEGSSSSTTRRSFRSDCRSRLNRSARHGLELAREILAAHGLGLSEAAPRVYAVVRDPGATRNGSHCTSSAEHRLKK